MRAKTSAAFLFLVLLSIALLFGILSELYLADGLK